MELSFIKSGGVPGKLHIRPYEGRLVGYLLPLAYTPDRRD